MSQSTYARPRRTPGANIARLNAGLAPGADDWDDARKRAAAETNKRLRAAKGETKMMRDRAAPITWLAEPVRIVDGRYGCRVLGVAADAAQAVKDRWLP